MAFLIIIYYARVLGKADFGKISLAQSILMYFTMITLFGFQTYGTREVSRDKGKTESLVGDIVSLRLIIAALCFISIILIGFLSNKGMGFRNVLIIYGTTLFPLAFNIDWVFSGTQEMEHNGVYNVIKNLIPFILVVMFFKRKEDIYLIPVFTFIGMLIAVFYQMYIYKIKKNLKYNVHINNEKAGMYTKIAFPFFVSSLLSMINCNIDSIIIGFIRTDAELGIYSSAYKIVFFLTNVIAMVFTPLFPVMIEYKNMEDRSYLDKLMRYISKVVVMLAVPICVGGILLSKDIVVLLFGKEYVGAYIPLAILLIYILLLFMRETYGYGLNAWNMEKEYLKTVTISSITNLVLNLILIPFYGIAAAALTTVISEAINYFLMQKYAFRVAKTSYLENILKIIIPTLVMVLGIVTMKFFNLYVIINIIVSIFIYFVCIIQFKYVTLGEIRGFLKKKSGI